MPDRPAADSRSLVLAHLDGQPVDRLPAMPITMMFAARYAGIPYRAYCTDYRALVRAQLAVAGAFGFDHVSCISDPAREAADLGAEIQWLADQPPAFMEGRSLLADPVVLAGLRLPDPLGGGRMTDRVRAAEALVAARSGRLVEGWVEGPCAEGADLRGLGNLMLDFHDAPAFVADVFEFTLELGIRFARAQVDAGVDIVGVGDAAASLVGPAIYREVVAPYERRLVDAIHAMGARVRLHICGNTSRSVGEMAGIGADILDLDAPVPMSAAREAAGADQVLLGNLNPVTALLQATASEVRDGIAACHAAAGSRYVVGVGCEVPRDTAHANVRALVEYAQSAR